MKKLMIMLCFLNFTISQAQISKVETTEPEEIGKIYPMGQLIIKCEKYDDTYVFTYKDWKFKLLNEFKSFSFVDKDDAFEELYQMIQNGFKEMPDEDIMLELPDGYLWLSFKKVMFVKQITFSHAVDKNSKIIGFSRGLTNRDINKLFGK